MKPDELNAFKRLPNKITIYRAHRPNETDWIAYTTDAEIATRFARERKVKEFKTYRVKKSDVLVSSDGAIKHTGDDRTGGMSDSGPDEVIKVDLTKMSATYSRVDFVVTIYDAVARKQNFGQMTGIFMNVVDKDTGAELLRYDMDEDFSLETSVIFGSVIREDGKWNFKAVGQGYEKDLAAIVRQYGLDA